MHTFPSTDYLNIPYSEKNKGQNLQSGTVLRIDKRTGTIIFLGVFKKQSLWKKV